MNLLGQDLISKFAFKVHDGVVCDRATDQASHKLLSLKDGEVKVEMENYRG
jgi:hypothetical protein